MGRNQPEICIKSVSLDDAIERINRGLWNLKAVNVEEAHRLSCGGEVTIAVIDSGVDYNHPSLSPSYKGGVDLSEGGDPLDTKGHGTFVAGIIAGEMTGVAPRAKIYSVKVYSSEEGGYTDLNLGIEWCLDNDEGVKIDIINISLGSPEYWGLVDLNCSRAVSKGIPVVAAAGNNYSGAFFPSSHQKVISVAAVKEDDGALEHCDYSNLWPTVDISAPGDEILSLEKGGGYCLGGGTSAAAPHITGVLALGVSLLKKAGKDIDPEHISKCLMRTALRLRDDNEAKYLSSRYDPGKLILRSKRKLARCMFGRGIVQADKFLQALL